MRATPFQHQIRFEDTLNEVFTKEGQGLQVASHILHDDRLFAVCSCLCSNYSNVAHDGKAIFNKPEESFLTGGVFSSNRISLLRRPLLRHGRISPSHQFGFGELCDLDNRNSQSEFGHKLGHKGGEIEGGCAGALEG